MSLGTQINVKQEFAPPGAPATELVVPTTSTPSQFTPNGSAPVAAPTASIPPTISGSGMAGVPAPPSTQPPPSPVANGALASTAALMGPPPPQPQHITVERGCQKKTRLVWTQELHMRFLFAVEKIGLRTAVPRTILQVMQVDGLTRENIASHLQKYRRLLEKKAGISGPVGTKDWPKLEAAQTHHLAQLRKQMASAPAAADASNAAAGATSSGTLPEPAAAAPAAADEPQNGAAPAAAPAQTTAGAAAAQPPQQMAAPVSAAPPAPSPATSGLPAPSWPPQAQAQPPPAACMPPPATPHQLPQPGICPVAPQEPAQLPVPTSDAEGNTLGVPMPHPIMPPLMCVLPQADGSPALLPMLPAMYMASYGRNTPDFLGTVPLARQQVPGMPALATPAHPQPYPHAHAHAHAHAHPMHHMGPAGMGMYAASYSYPSAAAPQYHAMPLAQPAGIGSPMFPPSYAPQMHVAPMPSPVSRDPSMLVHHAPDMPGMHGGYAWQRPSGWRPPTGKGAGHATRSTLPPLVAEHAIAQHAPPSATPASHGAAGMQARASSGAHNGARDASDDFAQDVDHDPSERDMHGAAGRSTAARQARRGNRSAANRRAHSGAVSRGDMQMDTADPDAAAGGSGADVDWGDDEVVADGELGALALTSSTLRIANMKLDPGAGDGSAAAHHGAVDAVLGDIPNGDVGEVPDMDLDELGWAEWSEPGNSSENLGDVDLG